MWWEIMQFTEAEIIEISADQQTHEEVKNIGKNTFILLITTIFEVAINMN